MLNEININSKTNLKIAWAIFTIIATAIGFKLRNMKLTIVFLVGIPTMLFLIKKPKRLIYAQIIYILLIKMFITMFGFPNSAMYLTDIINILAFIIAIGKKLKEKQTLDIKIPLKFLIALLVFSVIGLIINGQRIALFVWGLRNTYRGFVFLYSCIVLLDKDDINKIFNIFNIVFVFNIILCTYQYFVLHLYQDFIGGTFGIEFSANAYMNVYSVIMFTYSLIKYLNKSKPLSYLLMISMGTLYIAALSELKVFFLEFIIIIVLGILLSRFSLKTILFLGIATISVAVAMNAFYTIYPKYKGYFTIENVIEASSNDRLGILNRLTALRDINYLFLKDNKTKSLGLGLGSTDTSKVEIFNSDFYKKYGEDLRYTWLFDAMFTLENGYIGLILYLLILLSIFYENGKMKKFQKDKTEYRITQILSIMSVVLMWYNASLRTESIYMIVFGLSLGYIYNKPTQKLLVGK